MAGSFTSARMSVILSQAKMLTFSFAGMLAGGLSVYLLGGKGYIYFANSMFVFSFFMGFSRPVSSSLVLEQVKTDIGSASSFMVFYQFMAGALCMWAVTQPRENPIAFYGALTTSVSVLVLGGWPFLFKWLRNKGGI